MEIGTSPGLIPGSHPGVLLVPLDPKAILEQRETKAQLERLELQARKVRLDHSESREQPGLLVSVSQELTSPIHRQAQEQQRRCRHHGQPVRPVYRLGIICGHELL